MTFVFEKTFGKFDSSTNFEGNKLIVEYVISSVSNEIKVVEMTRIGANEFGEIGENFHRMNWMSKEGQASLMEDLENDYLDNHSTSRTRQGLLSDGEMNFLRNNLLNSFDAATEADLMDEDSRWMSDEEESFLNSKMELSYGI